MDPVKNGGFRGVHVGNTLPKRMSAIPLDIQISLSASGYHQPRAWELVKDGYADKASIHLSGHNDCFQSDPPFARRNYDQQPRCLLIAEQNLQT